jgi:ABC-type multidrug transport system fused ATPase/permease subunit
VIEGGRLAELGTHSQLLAAGRLYSRLYALQHPAADPGQEVA